MSAQVPTVELSPIQLAAQDNSCLEIIENYLMNLSHDPKYTDDLILSIQAYIVADNKDGNKSYKALALLAGLAKVNDGRKAGIFKCVGQIKNDPQFLDLVAKYTPDLQVSGGNERGTIVTVGSTATEVVNTPKPTKGTKGTKVQKPAKEKAPKKEKAAKVLPPMPTIADLAQLEAMDRKSLMSAMSAVNCHVLHTGVKGNGKTDDILKALAKHILGVDSYQPVPTLTKEEKKYSIRVTKVKEDGTPHVLTLNSTDMFFDVIEGMSGYNNHVRALVARGGTYELKNIMGSLDTKLELVTSSKSKGTKAPKELTPLDMPTDLTWGEVLKMKFRDLQGLAKVFRSHGLYEGNLAGKGVTKEHLLNACKEAMRTLGHEIIEANITPQNPDTATPTLERPGMRYDLHCQATELLAA